MKKQNTKLLLTVLILSIGVMVAEDEKEKEIPISEVPEIVMEAALKALPGVEFKEADVEETKDGLVYELDGILDGKEFEINVSADGTVLNMEEEEKDDDDENDGDKDEEDEDIDEDEQNDDDDDDLEDRKKT